VLPSRCFLPFYFNRFSAKIKWKSGEKSSRICLARPLLLQTEGNGTFQAFFLLIFPNFRKKSNGKNFYKDLTDVI